MKNKDEVRVRMGRIVVTRDALTVVQPEDLQEALARHEAGSWGDCDPMHRLENEISLADGGQVLSVHHDRNGVQFWVLTSGDRSVTTVLLGEND